MSAASFAMTQAGKPKQHGGAVRRTRNDVTAAYAIWPRTSSVIYNLRAKLKPLSDRDVFILVLGMQLKVVLRVGGLTAARIWCAEGTHPAVPTCVWFVASARLR
jgi:hypothetical protein